MRSLNNLGITVPGGFRWKCADTGQWVPATGHMVSYTDFIYAARKHCIANNIPIGSQWEQQIQAQLCAALDGEWCNENGYPVPPHGGWAFNVQQVIQANQMLAQKMIQAKARRVPAAESTQRASICLGCPMNQSPEGCSTCNADSLDVSAKNIVADVVVTAHDARLRSCKVSGFSLKAKINVPLDILLENLTDAQKNALPSHCWLK